MIQSIYYNSPEFRTLGDFLRQEGLSPAFSYKDDPNQFLNLKDKSGKSNFDKILEATPQEERQEQQNKRLSGLFNEIQLNPPIVFSIDSKKAKTDLFSVQGDLVQNTENINLFISKNLAQILDLSIRLKSKTGEVFKTTHPKLTVWLWSRTLSYSLGSSERGMQTNYELINLSPFIENINVSSTKEGSSFSLTLPPIKGSLTSFAEGWKIKKSSVQFLNTKEGLEYRAISHVEDKNLQTKDFFFHNIIQQNDLIFISFEDLPFERNKYRSDINVPFSAINSKIWDFIGLVDSNQLDVSKQGKNEVQINISGRDLTKLIIEDGTYFWPLELGLDGTSAFAGNRDGRIAKRIGSEGFVDYFSISNKSIEYSLRFIISQLANTGICPNYIFNGYGQRRSTVFVEELTGERETILSGEGNELNVRIRQKRENIEVVADGVWALTKIIIDPQISNLRLVDASLFVEQGSLINHIQRICQEPFVEFYTETIGDQFYWIARRPPYDKQAILDSINGVQLGTTTTKEQISVEINGVESIREFDVSTVNASRSFVIDVFPEDVIHTSLRFDERAYSWYKLESRYAFGGGGDNITSLALLPAVFIPVYTEIFGSRPLNVGSNYVNYVPTSGLDDEKNYLNALEQAYQDLAWLVQTNSYLPFTRTGTLTINEDRRIKKGMHVRLNTTGEIFLVTAVTHQMSISNSIERTTTLQVERGMVEKFIEGQEVEGIGRVGYFELVSTPVNIKRIRAQKSGQFDPIGLDGRTQKTSSDSILANWRENKSIIDFFIKRQQFS